MVRRMIVGFTSFCTICVYRI